MLGKRYYILFVAREEDGRIRKIPIPLRYAYGFVAAALVGAFTIVGLAGSYTRMLLKTESFNQVRQERETLRKGYKQMAQIAHDRNVQVASLGALANEVTALYGLRQNKLASAKATAAASAAAEPTPASMALTDDVNQQQVKLSIDQFYVLRAQAMSGRVSRALESGLSSSFAGDWTELADAPSLWPLEGRVGSSFGERQDPINGAQCAQLRVDARLALGLRDLRGVVALDARLFDLVETGANRADVVVALWRRHEPRSNSMSWRRVEPARAARAYPTTAR